MNEGYGIKRIINYRVKHNQKFSENFVKDLKLNMPDMVYVYSQNSAKSFLNFIKNQQLLIFYKIQKTFSTILRINIHHIGHV